MHNTENSDVAVYKFPLINKMKREILTPTIPFNGSQLAVLSWSFNSLKRTANNPVEQVQISNEFQTIKLLTAVRISRTESLNWNPDHGFVLTVCPHVLLVLPNTVNALKYSSKTVFERIKFPFSAVFFVEGIKYV